MINQQLYLYWLLPITLFSDVTSESEDDHQEMRALDNNQIEDNVDNGTQNDDDSEIIVVDLNISDGMILNSL